MSITLTTPRHATPPDWFVDHHFDEVPRLND